MEIGRVAELLNYLVLDLFGRFVDANFYELGRILILGQLDEMPSHLLKDVGADLVTVLVEHLGDHKVAKFILDELKAVLKNLVYNDGLTLGVLGLLYQLFHDAKALLVSGQIFEFGTYLFKDIIALLLIENCYNFLNHVLPLLIHREVAYIVIF